MDTSTPAVTVGVVDTEMMSVLAQRVTVDPRAHTELLVPHTRDVLAESGRAFADLDAIVVGVGPGPFTGLRVGMVTASSLGFAAQLPVYGVCSLDAIAASVDDAPLLVVSDARRKELYWAAYDGVRIREPQVAKPADILAQTPDIRLVAGAGVQAYPEVFADHTVLDQRYPQPLGLVAAADFSAEPGELTPLYLRRPDAEVPGARKRVT